MQTKSQAKQRSSAKPATVWERHARQLIRDAMHKKRKGWKQMSAQLAAIGIDEDPKVLANRINRGRFQAALLLQFMAALEMDELRPLWKEFPQTDSSESPA